MIVSLLLVAAVLSADLTFQRHDVTNYPTPYQIAVADLNGDGKPDVLVLSTQANRVDWFENPTWKPHEIARTDQNIDLAPRDLEGDGKPGIALASGFYFRETNRGGEIQWLKPGTPGQAWTAFPIARDPVVHRLRWGDLDGDGRPELVHAPILGPGSRGTASVKPSHLWAFRSPKHPGDPWEKWVIDETLTMIHGVYVGDVDGHGRDSVLTASFEGIHRFDRKQDRWRKVHITVGASPINDKPGSARGSSEVVPVRLGSKRMLLAAVEPWHGHQLVVYSPNDEGAFWKRLVLDESLKEGHALVAADFDGDGQDEIIVGWRGAGGGVRLFHLNGDGTSWHGQELGRGVAAEAVVAADINGDGKLDIVVSAGRNNKVLWYENQGPSRQ